MKSWSFEVHGCIDKYIRQVKWLNVKRFNKDPEDVIRNHFLIAKKAPLKSVTDWGKGNASITGS